MTYTMVVKSSNNLTTNELFESVELITNTFGLEKMSKDDKLMLKQVNTIWVMVKLNDEIVGVATLYDKKEDNLKNITINKSHRQKGLCKWILMSVRNFYNANNKVVQSPTLTVKRMEKSTICLVDMYIKHGYQIYKIDDDYYFLKLI